MPEAACWPAFQSHWQSLQDTLGEPPCVLIDAAGVEGHVRSVPVQALSSFDSLFEGDLADECAEVAPYLGQAASWEDAVARALWPLIDRRAAMLLWPVQPVHGCRELRRHLRKFNIVYSDQGVPNQFRYYDARVLLQQMESQAPVMDLQPLLRPFAGLLTVDGADEIRLISLRHGRAV